MILWRRVGDISHTLVSRMGAAFAARVAFLASRKVAALTTSNYLFMAPQWRSFTHFGPPGVAALSVSFKLRSPLHFRLPG